VKPRNLYAQILLVADKKDNQLEAREEQLKMLSNKSENFTFKKRI